MGHPEQPDFLKERSSWVQRNTACHWDRQTLF
jgi:hypothetical protein